MASIKEIAKLAKVSPGTTSLVLNGKGDQLRISAATQQRIWEAARMLDYKPNISARRLRSGQDKVSPIIALLWTLDARASLIGPFLKGIQTALSESEEEYDLLIQPFVGSRLSEVRSLISGTRFNGAIITNPTEEDEEFLANSKPNVPIVLYQRSSDKYACVNIDNHKSGQTVASLLANRGHREAGIIYPDVSSTAIRLRKEGFLAKAEELGLKIKPEHIIAQDFSESGGYNALRQMLQTGSLPTALFVASDQMAVGTLTALHEQGIRVPEDLEIVSHDDYEIARFTNPPLTTMHLPLEEMAKACVEILIDLMNHKITEPVYRHFDTHLVVRKSCGDFK